MTEKMAAGYIQTGYKLNGEVVAAIGQDRMLLTFWADDNPNAWSSGGIKRIGCFAPGDILEVERV
jgi:hypothetical protein